MAIALINGIQYSSVNITLIIPLVGPVSVLKLSYNVKQKKDNLYTLEKRPTGRGYGMEEYDASITMFKEQWNKIVDRSPNKNPLELPPFSGTVVFSGVTTSGYRKEVIEACEFTTDNMTVSAGDTSLKIEVGLIIGGVTKF
jgi:hypothetical protein